MARAKLRMIWIRKVVHPATSSLRPVRYKVFQLGAIITLEGNAACRLCNKAISRYHLLSAIIFFVFEQFSSGEGISNL